ncbi:MAG: hypothetical protein EOO11_14415 [Chitinophagaceae bacterium]|nr:MAG: hypothetical protein EOO11_14415 [Chitinophagaceae bacterium]
MTRYVLCAFTVLCLACSPYRALRPASFTYTGAGGLRSVPLKVPRGWKATHDVPTADGAQCRFYRYRDSSVFYVAFLPSGGDLQPIDRSEHLPKLRPNGDTSYKQQAGDLYWREDKKGVLRAGYLNVPEGKPEMRFDSAVNFVNRQS